MFSVDVRSRLDSEVDQIDLDAWIDDQLPLLLDKNSLIASEGAQILGCRPLGIRVSKKSFTLTPSDGAIKLESGVSGASVIVDLDEISFLDLVQDIQTPQSPVSYTHLTLPTSDLV